jgi:hypothetical protein
MEDRLREARFVGRPFVSGPGNRMSKIRLICQPIDDTVHLSPSDVATTCRDPKRCPPVEKKGGALGGMNSERAQSKVARSEKGRASSISQTQRRLPCPDTKNRRAFPKVPNEAGHLTWKAASCCGAARGQPLAKASPFSSWLL